MGQRIAFAVVLCAALGLSSDAFGIGGVGMVLVSKSIPPATVAVIDPESGTSAGGGSTDVRIATGDVILFRFRTFPVPQQQIQGINSWITEYVPPNLQVVGIRILDENELAVPVDLPGLAENGTAVSANNWNTTPCSGGTCPPPDGGIAQLYQDTGIFFSTDADTARDPSNAFIQLDNGILVTDPAVIDGDSNLRAALGVDSPYYAHNLWDARQVELFGAQGGNTPHLFGSPVAGPDTYYRYEASGTTATPTLAYTDGPWQRVQYPGSLIATGGPATSREGDGMGRYVLDASTTGHDLTPNDPLPAGTNAVRIAAGASRGGRPVDVEIAFKVLGTPLDPGFGLMGGDVNCAESWGGDIAGSPTGADADNNPWGLFAPTPGCVFLNLLFDITSDRVVRDNDDTGGPGAGQNDMTFTIKARNLSLNPRTNVWVRQKYNPMRIALTDDVGIAQYPDMAPSCTIANCDGDGFDCIYWSVGTLDPSEEVTIRTNFEVSNGGDPTTPIRADFTSDDLGTVVSDPCTMAGLVPGFVTQETVQIRSLGVIDAELSTTSPTTSPGGTATVSGTVSVEGTQSLTMNDFWLTLAGSAWRVADSGGAAGPDITVDGTRYECSDLCGTSTPRFEGVNLATSPGVSRDISFGVVVPGGTAMGNYPVDLHVISGQSGYGGRKEFVFNDAALIPVGGVRSTPPELSCPILSSMDAIPGTTVEADGTIIRIYFNGIVRGMGQSDPAGDFLVSDSPPLGSGTPWSDAGGTFGSLYGGLEVRATAQAPGENESELSAACFVQAVPACSDGDDNDGDGLIDFPADPGCSSPDDPDESDPECSDGIDNDGDGDTDYPDDLGCSSPDDDSEGGTAECNDGLDNDGDGAFDTADSCCTDAADPSETCYRQCNDREDNADPEDTLVDFPADLGCHAVNDDDETDLVADTDIFARLLFVFDTSGSMNWNTCDETFTGGDGTLECPGNDVLCADCGASGCGNTTPDDSRIDKAKRGLSNVVAAYGEVEWGLMRFHQRPIAFGCPTINASGRSGGWQGAGGACAGSEFDAGDLLVGFGSENQYDLLEWMDGQSNYPGGTPPPTMDFELRGTGTTPIAGSLTSALSYLSSAQGVDPRASCRPYRVILITDGQETCGGNPVTAAGNLDAAGFPTHVIGFAVDDPAAVTDLNNIASAGGTGSAIFVDDETTLSAEVADIVGDTVLVETCNGIDDDCDTLIDEGFTLFCNWDGTGTAPTPDLCTDPGETLCDGFDNNCNGLVDEGLLNACGECGPTPTEVCDRIDNDCDGVIDEDDVCGGCSPEPEICDGMDNDCDGVADEDLTRTCGTDVGVCATGIETCTAGAWGGCTATGGSAEVCNNLDDDCDGVVDQITEACGTDVGACVPGTRLCTAGTWGSCVGAIGGTTEICNTIDDDCDGTADEGNPGGGGTCGTSIGECDPGTYQCMGGVLVCTGGTSPSAEICDGLDNDCDGTVDESVPTGGSCGDDTGECRAGVLTCDGAGSFVCIGARGPTTEICDGLDNDCDGTADEGDPGGGASCGTDEGVCTPGTTTCSGGSLVCTGGTMGSAELCNTLDDDCDGRIDEGNPEGGAACGDSDVGECELGVETCVSGSVVCIGDTGPATEICDGLDNDCDGSTDEGNPEGGAACGDDTGECVPGTTLCVSGSLVCDGATEPTPEVCDGLDNDCDGVIDDGIPVGAPCGSDVGECVPGVNICVDGDIVCEGELGPVAETCNALDDDCDGAVDEELGLGGPCGMSEGLCMEGTIQCVGGRERCVGEVPPAREACDCLDNDCDGDVDEPPDSGALCAGGAECIECECARECVVSEFSPPCPAGKEPREIDGTCWCLTPPDEECMDDECALETVEVDGEAACAPDTEGLPSCVCKENVCTFACDGVVCGEGLVCRPSDGRCGPEECPFLPCGTGELCDLSLGECFDDPCSTVTCDAGEACRLGECEGSCGTVMCDSGEKCEAGVCVTDLCSGVDCGSTEVCDPETGECTDNLCLGIVCREGTRCDPLTGGCGPELCYGLHCPEMEMCDPDTGECEPGEVTLPDGGMPPEDGGTTRFDSGTIIPDRDAGPPDVHVLAGGGGGCTCTAAGAEERSTNGPWWSGLLGLALAGLLIWRRRSR